MNINPVAIAKTRADVTSTPYESTKTKIKVTMNNQNIKTDSGSIFLHNNYFLLTKR